MTPIIHTHNNLVLGQKVPGAIVEMAFGSSCLPNFLLSLDDPLRLMKGHLELRPLRGKLMTHCTRLYLVDVYDCRELASLAMT